jgi:hypothetical protein
MNSLEKLSTGLATKESKAKFIQECKDEILSGNVNPLQTEVYLKNLADIIKKIREDKEVKEYVMTEAEKNGKSFDFMGNKIAVSSKRTFDYSQCGHTEYNKLVARKKEIETFLQAMKSDMQVFDEESGERISPPTFTTSSFLTITQK